MKTHITALLTCTTLLTTLLASSLSADQVNEFSVFQPIDGISANIYIEHSKVIVQSSGTNATALKNIRAEYLTKYANQLYKIADVDHNGTVDIATLDSVDRASTRFCYKVYSYQPSSRTFGTEPTHTECSSAAGTVVYATHSAFASK